jgi:hypothetical protein
MPACVAVPGWQRKYTGLFSWALSAQSPRHPGSLVLPSRQGQWSSECSLGRPDPSHNVGGVLLPRSNIYISTRKLTESTIPSLHSLHRWLLEPIFVIGMSLSGPIDITSGCKEGLPTALSTFFPGVDSELRGVESLRHYPMGHSLEIG